VHERKKEKSGAIDVRSTGLTTVVDQRQAPYLTVPVDHPSAKHTKNSIHIHNRRICLALLILRLDKLTLFNLLYSDVGTASPPHHVFPPCHSLQPKVPLDDQSHCKAPYPCVTASSAITITRSSTLPSTDRGTT